MKIKNLIFCVLLASAGLAGCGKEGNPGFSFEKKSASIVVGEEMANAIINGIAPYHIESYNKDVVSATLDKNIVKIKGLKKGSTAVVVSDKDGKRIQFAVEVKENPKKSESIRLEWDGKTETGGKFAQTKEGTKTTFSWASTDGKNSVSLEFDDKSNLIRRGASVSTNTQVAKSGTLRVVKNGGKAEKHKVSSVTLIKSETSKDGKSATVWLKFTADRKEGLFVVMM